MKKIRPNGEKLKDNGVLCDDYLYYEKSGKGINQRIYKYSIGDTIIGKLDNKETSFKVGAITDIRPYGIEKSYYDGGYLIVNLDYYKDMNFKLLLACMDDNVGTKVFIKQDAKKLVRK